VKIPESSIRKFEEFTVAVIRLLSYYIPEHKQIEDKSILDMEIYDE
jgi:hypothetical protein